MNRAREHSSLSMTMVCSSCLHILGYNGTEWLGQKSGAEFGTVVMTTSLLQLELLASKHTQLPSLKMAQAETHWL